MKDIPVLMGGVVVGEAKIIQMDQNKVTGVVLIDFQNTVAPFIKPFIGIKPYPEKMISLKPIDTSRRKRRKDKRKGK